MSKQIERVAVVGGGLMGSGIAETVARAGLTVVVREIDDQAAQLARERVVASLERGRGRTEPDPEAVTETLGRISFTSGLEEVAGADLVIEAVAEDVGLKTKVLQETAEVVSTRTIIASNTSSIAIAELAAAVPEPERVLGLHFFSPVPAMKLVEVVVALDTSPATVKAGHDFARRIGKTAIETKDRSGFVVNMLLVPYLMAAIRMFEEGFALAEAIDEAMVRGCGHPMGPLTLCDFIGLDVLYAVCQSLYDEFKRPDFAPPPILKRMVVSGRLGRKSGRGFYRYEAGHRQLSGGLG